MKVSKAYQILKDPKMANLDCNFKILKKKPTTLDDIMQAISDLDKKLTARIDNLVAKNNLKE